MRRKLPLLVLLFPWFIFPIAPAQSVPWVTLAASNIKDGSGAPLASGTLCVRPVSTANQALNSAAAGVGGGAITTNEVCTPITGGTLPGVWWPTDPTAGGSNLVPSPTAFAGWTLPANWSTGTGTFESLNALLASSSSALYSAAVSPAIAVTPGSTYTLYGAIDGTNITAQTAQWAVFSVQSGALLGKFGVGVGVSAQKVTQFVIPAGTTSVTVQASINNATIVSGNNVLFAAPMLQLGFSQVADTSITTPNNLCYRVTVRSANGAAISTNPCVQPANATANSGLEAGWCSTTSGATSCNFDLYTPTVAAQSMYTLGTDDSYARTVAGAAVPLAGGAMSGPLSTLRFNGVYEMDGVSYLNYQAAQTDCRAGSAAFCKIDASGGLGSASLGAIDAGTKSIELDLACSASYTATDWTLEPQTMFIKGCGIGYAGQPGTTITFSSSVAAIHLPATLTNNEHFTGSGTYGMRLVGTGTGTQDGLYLDTSTTSATGVVVGPNRWEETRFDTFNGNGIDCRAPGGPTNPIQYQKFDHVFVFQSAGSGNSLYISGDACVNSEFDNSELDRAFSAWNDATGVDVKIVAPTSSYPYDVHFNNTKIQGGHHLVELYGPSRIYFNQGHYEGSTGTTQGFFFYGGGSGERDIDIEESSFAGTVGTDTLSGETGLGSLVDTSNDSIFPFPLRFINNTYGQGTPPNFMIHGLANSHQDIIAYGNSGPRVPSIGISPTVSPGFGISATVLTLEGGLGENVSSYPGPITQITGTAVFNPQAKEKYQLYMLGGGVEFVSSNTSGPVSAITCTGSSAPYTCTATANNNYGPYTGGIQSIAVTAGGTSYPSNTTVTGSGGTCTGPINYWPTISSGVITAINWTGSANCGGSGGTAPTLTITGSGGSGASATVNLSTYTNPGFVGAQIYLANFGASNPCTPFNSIVSSTPATLVSATYSAFVFTTSVSGISAGTFTCSTSGRAFLFSNLNIPSTILDANNGDSIDLTWSDQNFNYNVTNETVQQQQRLGGSEDTNYPQTTAGFPADTVFRGVLTDLPQTTVTAICDQYGHWNQSSSSVPPNYSGFEICGSHSSGLGNIEAMSIYLAATDSVIVPQTSTAPPYFDGDWFATRAFGCYIDSSQPECSMNQFALNGALKGGSGVSGTGTKIQSTNMSSTTGSGDIVTTDTAGNTVDSGQTIASLSAGNNFLTGTTNGIIDQVEANGAASNPFEGLRGGDITLCSPAPTEGAVSATSVNPYFASSESAAAAGDCAGWRGLGAYHAARLPEIIFAVDYPNASDLTTARSWLGLATTTATLATLAADDTPGSTSSIAFAGVRFSTAASDTHFQCVAGSTANQTAVDTGITPANGTLYIISVAINSGNVVCTINGTATTNSGSYQPSGALAPFFLNAIPSGSTQVYLYLSGWKGWSQNAAY